MTEHEKINGWTFEETVKTAENLMEIERNMFRLDVLRHLRDFAENYKHELEQYTAIGTPDECCAAVEKQKTRKPIVYTDTNRADCPVCGATIRGIGKPFGDWCSRCGQKLDWSDEEC